MSSANKTEAKSIIVLSVTAGLLFWAALNALLIYAGTDIDSLRILAKDQFFWNQIYNSNMAGRRLNLIYLQAWGIVTGIMLLLRASFAHSLNWQNISKAAIIRLTGTMLLVFTVCSQVISQWQAIETCEKQKDSEGGVVFMFPREILSLINYCEMNFAREGRYLVVGAVEGESLRLRDLLNYFLFPRKFEIGDASQDAEAVIIHRSQWPGQYGEKFYIAQDVGKQLLVALRKRD